MKLLIISHTPHYRKHGEWVGWGPTVREIDHLSQLFDQVVHVAPGHSSASPESSLAYQSPSVRIRAVPPAGGRRMIDKFSIIIRVPTYLRTILSEIKNADVVHVRCPANISLISLLLLAFIRQPSKRWFKYAGNWHPEGGESRSYTFQRWWLRRFFSRGKVTVNGVWPEQPNHIHSFLNPCLTDMELRNARESSLSKELTSPLRLLFVGRLETAKGIDRILEIAFRLHQIGKAFHLDLVGDGPEKAVFIQKSKELGIQPTVTFHGWLPRTYLSPLYAQSHLFLLPTNSEGWPKVLSEAMAYGVVPLASAVSSIPQYLNKFKTGKAFKPNDLESFAETITWYTDHPNIWKEESENAKQAAGEFTYFRYLQAVAAMLNFDEKIHSLV